jgi:ATP-dependent DNA helicase RecG
MLDRLIAESTEYEFKREVGKEKPKNWLKTVSAFANGIGGTLFFGIDDDKNVLGIADIKADSAIISKRIKDRIAPVPHFVLTPHKIKEKDVLVLNISSGANTPYYYKSDGRKEAFIRIGDESVPAPDHILHELILKGTNQTFDSLITDFRKEDYSFSLLQATYLQRTGVRFEQTDYISFGLVSDDGFLTNAGKLLTDQHLVYNSRIFCTRWDGLDMGSIHEDALDDKEYEGNLINLLTYGCSFVKSNSKVRFKKEAMQRVDKPDYAERAITEALVNALIHRDYLILGSEVHIDMFDDRLEIYSPGGMFNGKIIQNENIKRVGSSRRNPVIADLFHRMKYMERRGSGLKKIIKETELLAGYTEDFKPEFESTAMDFRVIFKNVNYSSQDTSQVSSQDTSQDVFDKIITFCKTARTKNEICDFLNMSKSSYFNKKYLYPLIERGDIVLTIPDKPNSKNQKYVST